MFHVELRQFPHVANRFNLDDAELWAIMEPWARERLVELGERKWSPAQTKITVLEGPELPLDALSMGRGWKAAQRESRDVTEHVVAESARVVGEADRAAEAAAMRTAAEEVAAAQRTPDRAADDGAPPDPEPVAEIPAQLAALLGEQPQRLFAQWRAAAARAPGLLPSESLALAEHAIRASGAGRD